MTDTSLTDLKQRLREFAAARDDVNGFTNVVGAQGSAERPLSKNNKNGWD